jgi:transposase
MSRHELSSGIGYLNISLIRAALENALNDTNRMLLIDALEILDNLESKMEKLSLEVLKKVQQKSKDLAIVMSISGIGFVFASVILSEIGDYQLSRFFEHAQWAVEDLLRIRRWDNLGIE